MFPTQINLFMPQKRLTSFGHEHFIFPPKCLKKERKITYN